MSSLETTELKLKTTPTGGISGEHSPYYRRLLSAGYKGFVQGTLGGAGFYGSLGAVIGALIAIPTMFLVPPVGIAALWMIPAATGVGMLKGANTFGNIGSVAAISAESADMAEQRRYLLDRYYDLPTGPEGDKQAELIKQELYRMNHSDRPHQFMHWKTALTCAAIGGVFALVITLAPMLLPVFEHSALSFAVHALEGAVGGHVAAAGISTALGALAGATFGIDRHYIRSWFDGSERMLHDDSHTQEALRARAHQIERIKQAAVADEQTKLVLERSGNLNNNDRILDAMNATRPQPTAKKAEPIPHSAIASLDTPDTKVSDPVLQNRLVDIQKAMQVPAV